MLNSKQYQAQLIKALFASDFQRDQQQQLLECLADDQQSVERLAVYRNNVFHSLITALGETYPVIKKLLGDECFNAIARAYVNQQPPQQAALIFYGESFPKFVASHPSCQDLDYLEDVASLEWCYLKAFHADDQAAIDISLLQNIAPDQLPLLTFEFNASSFLLESTWPVQAIWHANLQEQVPVLDLSSLEPSKLLICRMDYQVQVIDLEPNCFYFAQALAAGKTIEQAWQSTLAHNQQKHLAAIDESDLIQMLSYLFSLKLFTGSQLQQH